MRQKSLVTILGSVSVSELKQMVSAKEKLDALEAKKATLEKNLVSLNKQIETIQNSLEKPAAKKKAVTKKKRRGKKKATKKKGAGKKTAARKKARRKRAAQPSIPSLVVEILKEKKKPQSVKEICDALLNEKKYKTRAKNFGNQIRVLLYKNQKGFFKKVGPGKFTLA